MIYICMILWYLLGLVSMIYWSTKTLDVTLEDMIPIMCMSVLGPIAFIVGWAVNTDFMLSKKIIFKKRKEIKKGE